MTQETNTQLPLAGLAEKSEAGPKQPPSAPTGKRVVAPRNRRCKNRVGQRFGRLVVEAYSHSKDIGGKTNAFWKCRCDCGNTNTVQTRELKNGGTRSCGCLRLENASKLKLSHGNARVGRASSIYWRWSGMVQRCTNPNNSAYHHYGGRGIAVCDEWLEFRNFLSDMGPPPSGMYLDRIDNNKGYFKENCRWTDKRTSARNRRNAFLITFQGETLCATEWAERLGLRPQLIYLRRHFHKEVSPERLLRPVHKTTKQQQTP